jgi:hypothetical protein
MFIQGTAILGFVQGRVIKDRFEVKDPSELQLIGLVCQAERMMCEVKVLGYTDIKIKLAIEQVLNHCEVGV